jgi:hypothetical protein
MSYENQCRYNNMHGHTIDLKFSSNSLMRSRGKDQQSDMLDKYKGRKIFVYQNGIGQVSHNYDDIGITRSPGNYGQVVSINDDESPGFYSPLKMATYH